MAILSNVYDHRNYLKTDDDDIRYSIVVSYVVTITSFSGVPPAHPWNAKSAMVMTSVGMVTWEHPQHEEQLQSFEIGAAVGSSVGALDGAALGANWPYIVVLLGNAVGDKYVIDLDICTSRE